MVVETINRIKIIKFWIGMRTGFTVQAPDKRILGQFRSFKKACDFARGIKPTKES